MAEIGSILTAQPAGSLPLQDRLAIITGGSRGIGRSIALHLASLGAKIVVNYTTNSAQADLVAAQINSAAAANNHSPRAISVQADISDPAQVRSLFDAAESTFNSPPHILVNSAGILDSTCSSIQNISIEEFDRIFAVNTRGAFLCCKEAANRVKRGGGGRIICLSSSLVAALRPGYGAYSASKAAVEAMVKTLAKELKGTGITANCVSPGAVVTDMMNEVVTDEEMVEKVVAEIPMGRLGQPEDVATVVGFLASDGGEWINGQSIRTNGGWI